MKTSTAFGNTNSYPTKKTKISDVKPAILQGCCKSYQITL